MPLYEYKCRSCSSQFELLVRASEGAPACPSCQGHDLEKLLSAFSVASPSAAGPAPSACGRCGDPRGPGACSMN